MSQIQNDFYSHKQAMFNALLLEYIRNTLNLSTHVDSFNVCGDDSFQVYSTERAASSKIGREREVSIMRIDPTKHYPPVRVRLVGKKGVMVDVSFPTEFASDEVMSKFDKLMSKVLDKVISDDSYLDSPVVVTMDNSNEEDSSNDKIVDYPSEVKEEKEDDE